MRKRLPAQVVRSHTRISPGVRLSQAQASSGTAVMSMCLDDILATTEAMFDEMRTIVQTQDALLLHEPFGNYSDDVSAVYAIHFVCAASAPSLRRRVRSIHSANPVAQIQM